jgi:hypothetical protein
MTAVPSGENPSLEGRLSALETTVAKILDRLERSSAADNLAAPIAIPLLKEAGEHEFVGKFFALMDLGESLIKYSAALAFAVALEQKRPAGDMALKLFEAKPTLGKFVEALREVLNDKDLTTWPIDILRGAFREGKTRPSATARYLFDDFVSLRNRERGHASHQSEGYYEGLYLQNHLIVLDCVAACAHTRLPLLRIHNLNHAGDRFVYQASLLMGPAATRLEDHVVTHDRVAVGATCIWDRGERLLSLREFLAYRYCPICSLEHVFFCERLAKDAVGYHSYVGNHRAEAKRTGA